MEIIFMICGLSLGIVLGWCLKNVTYSKEHDNCENNSETTDKATQKHVVSAEDGKSFYSDVSITIDSSISSTNSSLMKYGLRDAVVAFHFVKYNEALSRQDKEILEAIGTSQIDCVKVFCGKTYEFKF